MKTEEQIEKMLEDSLKELSEIQKWYDSAFKNYQSNRKAFGEADFGEVA